MYVSVYVGVCMQHANFQNPWPKKFMFSMLVQLSKAQVIYQGHRFKVKDTRKTARTRVLRLWAKDNLVFLQISPPQ